MASSGTASAAKEKKIKVTVVGAGVIGLTNAMLLSRNPQYKVTVVAKHMPGDYDIEYASPWAGANYLPFAEEGSRDAEYETNTWSELEKLAKGVPEAGIHFQEVLLHELEKEANDNSEELAMAKHLMAEKPWYRNVVPNWRQLKAEELPAGVRAGTTFTSVCINTAIYLPWLASQCLRQGVTLHRGIVSHVTEPAKSPGAASFAATPPDAADIVVNCTGLSSLFLGGVRDSNLHPVRGQVVVVRNSAHGNMYTVTGHKKAGAEEFMYAMERAAGGGTVLGGCAQRDRWESQPDPSLALRLMQRCIDSCPALVRDGEGVDGLSVVRHAVGLRPARDGGIRVQSEQVDGVWVVHCYGHGGYGYQTSYGTTARSVALVDEIAKSLQA